MKIPRRQFLQVGASVVALPAASRVARAQAYPSRPVRIIVVAAAGGAADITARLMGQWLSERLGQHLISISSATSRRSRALSAPRM
jgi:tripartite-type tricarboxylate transporter receptor subunit TctC